jgi:hypothetical protein
MTEPMPLKPCPFCGDTAFLALWQPRTSQFTRAKLWRIGCHNDECPIGPHEDYEDRDKAIAAWNTRTPDEAALQRVDAVLVAFCREHGISASDARKLKGRVRTVFSGRIA